MVRRTKEEAEQTRNAILDAAEALFFEQGVARTTLEGIARAAGVTRGAVYWHFHDKVDLFEAMQARAKLPQEDVFHGLLDRADASSLEALCATLKEVLQLMVTDQRRRRVFTILFHRCEYVEEMRGIIERKQARTDEFMERATRFFEAAAARGDLAPHWLPAAAALSMHALLIGLLSRMLQAGAPDERAVALAQECVTAFFRSLAISGDPAPGAGGAPT
ncbi:AcrR family transcriptional regulator [Azospirillum agricola]|uniref:TetR family transcriptional regulator n=1 Tax=Azospirillum agricola TaxID=1720247 RepID=UPI001AEA79A7|nr:TetR family transcriptional regulator [Azospirillum agricola]MBP2228826.1 AcrR family transcriptional regulator [Azospirillum agricola]